MDIVTVHDSNAERADLISVVFTGTTDRGQIMVSSVAQSVERRTLWVSLPLYCVCRDAGKTITAQPLTCLHKHVLFSIGRLDCASASRMWLARPWVMCAVSIRLSFECGRDHRLYAEPTQTRQTDSNWFVSQCIRGLRNLGRPSPANCALRGRRRRRRRPTDVAFDHVLDARKWRRWQQPFSDRHSTSVESGVNLLACD